ncbi:CDC48 family AAA ATPase [Candidatus Aerophobetes bacterium]|nr:CDC48 family AAA ATPase [Candidatus Aerophobetes bacterium]
MSKKDSAVSLKAGEARPKDAGRGIVRIDPKDMVRIGTEVGDVVKVKAKRETVAKVMPAYMEDRGKDAIQMDGLLRENAKVGLGEKVSVEKTSCRLAEKLIICPLTVMKSMHQEKDRRYIGRLLEGLALIEGDRIRANLFGTRSQDFTVVSTTPEGPVLICPETIIKTKGEGSSAEGKAKVSYEDIGGVEKEIRKVREMIELPLKYPQIFDRLGIEAPKGVLLHGPPGCGKTLIARAVANETNAYFVHISGPEVIGKYYGESESRIRAIFEDAQRNAPAIVFIDEIDAIAPKREEMGGEKQVEKRVVAQLLALMDGLKSRGQVIVIAATNIPNVIDPALRRPGRFDREIEIGIPDKNGRLEILQIHTRGMPLSDSVNLTKMSQITHGFVGADLEALCREAAMVCLRGLFPKIDFELEEIPYEILLKLEVTMDDFMEALKQVEPSAIREIFTEIPDVRWSDVGGLDNIKEILQETIEWPLKYGNLFTYAATKPPKGILLYGPPGCGKTLLAKAVANEAEVNFISVKGPELLSKFVGESERGIREVFKKAKQASPCIIFFDEIDGLAPARGKSFDSHVSDRVISQFLTEMDGIEELKGVIILAATNRLDIIDPALLRSGRFDFLLEIPVPDAPTREKIFEVHTKGKPFASDVDLKLLVERSGGLSGADIELICKRAALLAIREFLTDRKGEVGEDFSQLNISTEHFARAAKMLQEGRGKIVAGNI